MAMTKEEQGVVYCVRARMPVRRWMSRDASMRTVKGEPGMCDLLKRTDILPRVCRVSLSQGME